MSAPLILKNKARRQIVHKIQCDRHRRWREKLPYFVIKVGFGYDVRLSGIQKGYWSPSNHYLGDYMEVACDGAITACRWKDCWYVDPRCFLEEDPSDKERVLEPNGGSIRKVGVEGEDDGFGLDRCRSLTDNIKAELDTRFIELTFECLPPMSGSWIRDQDGKLVLDEKDGWKLDEDGDPYLERTQELRIKRLSEISSERPPIHTEESWNRFIAKTIQSASACEASAEG